MSTGQLDFGRDAGAAHVLPLLNDGGRVCERTELPGIDCRQPTGNEQSDAEQTHDSGGERHRDIVTRQTRRMADDVVC